MFLIEKTTTFDKWLRKLNDRNAKARILFRLQRAENGNLGDVKEIGGGLSEMRIMYGKGYRLYFRRVDNQLILLLIGGVKDTQDRDIERAKKIWNTYQNGRNNDK